MGQTRKYQFLYSKLPMLTMADCHITFGSSGAVSRSSGALIASVTQKATGIYMIEFKENYNAFVGHGWDMESPVTGSNVNDGSFVANTPYQITAVGTTNWSAIGLPANVTPAVGQFFVASASGGSGSGTAKVIGTSAVAGVEVVQNPQAMLQSNNAYNNTGAYLMVQLLDYAGALVSPTSGSILDIEFYFRDSSVSY